MKARLASIILLSSILLLSQDISFAGIAGCGCYCGKVLPPPCSDDACKRACGWQEPSSGASQTGPSYDYEAEQQRQEAERQRQLEADRQRQLELEEQQKREEEEARKRQEEFERNKQEALKSMKGIAEGELGLKGADTGGDFGLKGMGDSGAGLGLKGIGDASVVDLSDKKGPLIVDPSVVSVQAGVANPVQLRKELLGNFSDAIHKRTNEPNKQALEIMRSFKTGEPPSPIKNMNSLAPGDVILVAPVPMKDRLRDETKQHLKDVMISNGINLFDRWGSDNWSSPASHTAIFLGERNGKRWYMDNTGAHGPVIKEEKEFLKEYGQRKMAVATMVGQPLSQHEGEELWKGAHELRNTTSYGIKIMRGKDGNDEMVCSETSRWLLMRSGRRVPETQSGDAKILGVDTGLNKNQFVKFSPSDFYEEQQYFIIHQLGMNRKEEKKQ